MFFIRVISGTGLVDKGKIDFAVSAAFCDKIIAVTDIADKERENLHFYIVATNHYLAIFLDKFTLLLIRQYI
ncbi:Uncharacterised protein [Mycobacterium tuberculosis]|nr:Uncharacterised protein [Mycobacterium tuberculosis]